MRNMCLQREREREREREILCILSVWTALSRELKILFLFLTNRRLENIFLLNCYTIQDGRAREVVCSSVHLSSETLPPTRNKTCAFKDFHSTWMSHYAYLTKRRPWEKRFCIRKIQCVWLARSHVWPVEQTMLLRRNALNLQACSDVQLTP